MVQSFFQDHQQSIAATIRERLKLPDSSKTDRERREDKLLDRVKKGQTSKGYSKYPKSPTLYLKQIERRLLKISNANSCQRAPIQ